MHLKNLASALHCIEAVSDLDAPSRAAFLAWLEQRGTVTVKSFAAKLTKLQLQPSSHEDEMSKLQSFVLILANVLEIAGARAPSVEVRTFAQSFAVSGHTVTSYIAAAEERLAKKPTKPNKQSASADIARVRRYVDLLLETQTDNASFDDAVLSMSKDKSISLPELLMIAERFIGYAVSGKNKKAVIAKIVDRQTLDARHAAKSAAIG